MGSTYIDVIGDGAHGFVADPDNTGTVTSVYKDGWMSTNYPRCRVDGRLVDMTEHPVGYVHRVTGWQIERTEEGLRARTWGVRLRG